MMAVSILASAGEAMMAVSIPASAGEAILPFPYSHRRGEAMLPFSKASPVITGEGDRLRWWGHNPSEAHLGIRRYLGKH